MTYCSCTRSPSTCGSADAARAERLDVRYWPKADICFFTANVRFRGKADMFLGIATKRTNQRFLSPVHRASAPIAPQIVQTVRGPRLISARRWRRPFRRTAIDRSDIVPQKDFLVCLCCCFASLWGAILSDNGMILSGQYRH